MAHITNKYWPDSAESSNANILNLVCAIAMRRLTTPPHHLFTVLCYSCNMHTHMRTYISDNNDTYTRCHAMYNSKKKESARKAKRRHA